MVRLIGKGFMPTSKPFDQKKIKKICFQHQLLRHRYRKIAKGCSHLRLQGQSLLGRHSGKLALHKASGDWDFHFGKGTILKKEITWETTAQRTDTHCSLGNFRNMG